MQTADKLYEASANGDVDVLTSLIQNDNFILDRISLLTCCNETPLHIAALRGHLQFVQILVKHKPDLASIVDVHGRTPLHFACAKGYVEIVKELVSVNFQVCISRDQDGRTPLHLAAMNEQVEVIRALLEMVHPEMARESIMLDVVVPAGETILHLCVKHRRLKSLKLLVEWRWGDEEDMVVNSKDHDGNTILHLAAILKDVQTTKYLLSRKTIKMKANSANDNGFTAMDVLEQCPSDSKSREMRKLLHEAGILKTKTNVPHFPPPTTSVLIPGATTVTTSDELESSLPKSSCFPLPKKTRNEHQRDGASGCVSWASSKVKRAALKLWHYIQAESGWLEEVRGNLMVAATVTATMAFQAGLNPPGGVWQETGTKFYNELSANITMIAGYSVASTLLPGDYSSFLHYNTASLVASLSTILLMISGFPLKCRFSMLLLVVTMCSTVVFILLTYIKSIAIITDDNYVSYYTTRNVSVVSISIWVVLCSTVLLIYILRLGEWLWTKFTRFRRRRMLSS